MQKKAGIFFLILFMTVLTIKVDGQSKFKRWLIQKPDTNYVESYYKDLILRVYGSQKYSAQRIIDQGEKTVLSYRPSNGYALGLGFNYKFLGINIGTVFPFAKPDIGRYGDTRYLDLQSHLYLRRFTIDFYTGYYKGQYLANTKEILKSVATGNEFYIRDDIRTYSGGFGIYTNLNPTKFSARGPFLQNEWQKHSAGQPMVGIELYWVGSAADSSFIPSTLKNGNFFDGIDFNRWQFYTMNLTSGYAYTFVIHNHYFIMFGINGSIGFGEHFISPVEGKRLVRFQPNYTLNEKFGVGYHLDRLFVGMSLANFQYFTPTPVPKTIINWNTGNLRFNVAYRFKIKHDWEIRPWKWFSKNGYFVK
jgi:hypothetical protein